MGLETAAAVGAGSQLVGAFQQDQANKRTAQANNAFRQQMLATGQGLMDTGTNPFVTQLNDFVSKLYGSKQGVNAGQINPSMVDMGSITPNLNPGNDAIMQLLRANPDNQLDPTGTAFLKDQVATGGHPFDTSSMFAALQPVDQRNINQQVNSLIASSSGGGLGERFGTAMADRGVNLRTRALQDINARNAGIQQQAYEAGMGRATNAADALNSNFATGAGIRLNAANNLNANLLNLAGFQLQGAQANAGAANTAAAANVTNNLTAANLTEQQRQAIMAQIFSAISGGANIANAQRQGNIDVYGRMFGVGEPSTVGASNIPGAIAGGFNQMSQAQILQALLANNGKIS